MSTSTDAWGIDARYLDSTEDERSVSATTVNRLREVIGRAPAQSADLPLIVQPLELTSLTGDVELEDGRQLELGPTNTAEVGYGYHHFTGANGIRRRLIVSPGRCHSAPSRAWVLAVQLYAARSTQSWGVGDLADLAQLGLGARQLGAKYLLVNPLHAVAPTLPQQSSPYFPSSRRFLNPIYIRVADVAGAEAGLLDDDHRIGVALNAAKLLDRDAAWTLKRRALAAIFDLGFSSIVHAQFSQWRSERGAALEQYATFCALAELHGSGWQQWPKDVQHPDAPGVQEFCRDNATTVTFHCWLQWLLVEQLHRAGNDVGIIQDLPIGFDLQGADGWCWQDLVATEATIGAPPDQFNMSGQDWGLPPFIPWKLREAGYQPFIDSIRSTMLTGGGLRIDHVMGLFRLWWIPRGMPATEGAYVRYPAADLLNIVALESYRAGAVVIGEDLGTVEPGVREAMQRTGMLSYRVMWFEAGAPSTWPITAMAAVTTHDLPTVTGLWTGADLDDQREAGVQADAASTQKLATNLAEAIDLQPDVEASLAVEGAYRLLAQSPSLLLSVTLDDAVGMARRPNIPGTTSRPNWSLPLPGPVEDLLSAPLLQRVAAQMTASLAQGAVDG